MFYIKTLKKEHENPKNLSQILFRHSCNCFS